MMHIASSTSRPPLAPAPMSLLPLGSIVPEGWLRRQLQVQANGLTGHLEEFWPDLGMNSAWLGGSGEGWERGPYYLDGLIPLAYLLHDDTLKARAQRWIDWALDHQQENGWLGPIHDTHDTGRRSYDAWPVFVMLKALTQYADATDDQRVVPAVTRFLAFLRDHLDDYPLFSWGQFRWAELALTIVWLSNRAGEGWLLDLARRIHDQGYNWTDHFSHFRYPERTRDEFGLATHVVNNAMGIKTPGIWSLFSQDAADRLAVCEALDHLDRYHGQVTGVFSGDEHLAGREPTQGMELCAVVEMMFSLEQLLPSFADPTIADRLERIAYNALPATFSPDMWAHQYDQQVNQVLCSVARRHWTNNHDDSNIFGLEPNFGCCTANMHQGWPKLATSLWMATHDGGVAAAVYAPCRVIVRIDGQDVTIIEETDYPFSEVVRITIACKGSVTFPLLLRIPSWCQSATIELADGATLIPRAGAFHRLERLWNTGEVVTLRLPMAVRAVARPHGAIALERGPLVYSLKIGEEWRMIGGEPPHGDWEVWPTTPWNYGLAIDAEHPEVSVVVESSVPVRELDQTLFAPNNAPIHLRVPARRLPQWTMEQHSAGPVPDGPVESDAPLETITLIPYGCTNLRITEFPVVTPRA